MMFTNTISLEKSGVKEDSLVKLINIMPFIGLKELNLASLSLSYEVIHRLIEVFDQ